MFRKSQLNLLKWFMVSDCFGNLTTTKIIHEDSQVDQVSELSMLFLVTKKTALGYFESQDCVVFLCGILFGSGHPLRRDVIPLRLWEADGPESFPNTNTGILHIPASLVV